MPYESLTVASPSTAQLGAVLESALAEIEAEFRDPARAVEILTELIEAQWDERIRRISSCRCSLGLAELQLGRNREAIRSFMESIKAGFGGGWEQLGLAIAYCKLGDLSTAGLWYRRAQQILQKRSGYEDIHQFQIEAKTLIDSAAASQHLAGRCASKCS